MKLKKALPILLSAALMLSFSACSKNEQPSGGADLSQVVATVGEENISALELKFYLGMDKEGVEKEAGLTDKTDEEKSKYWKTDEGVTKQKELIDRTLENLKELKLLVADANKNNIKLEQTELDGINDSIKQIIETEGEGDKAKADTAMLNDYGVTVDQYQSMFTEYVLAYQKYVQVKPTQIEISESDIQKEFDSNKEQYNKVTVNHILIGTVDPATNEKLPDDKVAEKKTLADDILKKVQAGEDFGELAKQYSEDPGSKDIGGEYTFPKGKMVAEFEDWSFNAKEGDMGVVETSYGYHVMKFIKHVPASLGDEEKASITASMQSEQFAKMIDEMKAKNEVVKNQKVIDSIELF